MLHRFREECERYSDIYSSLLLTALAAAWSRKRYVIWALKKHRNLYCFIDSTIIYPRILICIEAASRLFRNE